MLLLETLCPFARSATASFAWLFDTHSNSRIGSPSVAGSSNWRRSSSSVASMTASDRRPPPGRRTTPDSAAGSSRSFRPRPIVLRAIPVARADALIPPRPAERDSTAANSRRPRSSRLRRTPLYRSPIDDASTIRRVYAALDRAGIPNQHQTSRTVPSDSSIVGCRLKETSRGRSNQQFDQERSLAGDRLRKQVGQGLAG